MSREWLLRTVRSFSHLPDIIWYPYRELNSALQIENLLSCPLDDRGASRENYDISANRLKICRSSSELPTHIWPDQQDSNLQRAGLQPAVLPIRTTAGY